MNDGKFKVGALLLSFLLILGTFKEKDGGIPKNGTPISVVEQNFPSDIHETLEKVEQKEFVK